MPYTQAAILEIQRIGSVASPGERVAVEDNVIDGVLYPEVLKDHVHIDREHAR